MTRNEKSVVKELVEAVYDYLSWSNGDPCKDTDGSLAQLKRRERRMRKAAEEVEHLTDARGAAE